MCAAHVRLWLKIGFEKGKNDRAGFGGAASRCDGPGIPSIGPRRICAGGAGAVFADADRKGPFSGRHREYDAALEVCCRQPRQGSPRGTWRPCYDDVPVAGVCGGSGSALRAPPVESPYSSRHAFSCQRSVSGLLPCQLSLLHLADPRRVGTAFCSEHVDCRDEHGAVRASHRRLHIRRHRGSGHLCLLWIYHRLAGVAARGYSDLAPPHAVLGPSAFPEPFVAIELARERSFRHAGLRRTSRNNRLRHPRRNRIRAGSIASGRPCKFERCAKVPVVFRSRRNTRRRTGLGPVDTNGHVDQGYRPHGDVVADRHGRSNSRPGLPR